MKVYWRIVRSRRGFYDRVIGFWTHSDCVHAEFHWPVTEPMPDAYFGAQPMGGVHARNWNYLGDVAYDVYTVDMRPESVGKLTAFLASQTGKPYDFRAILNLGLFEGDVTTQKRWFCSELVFYALKHAGISLLRATKRESDRITPRDLAMSERATLVRHVAKGK